MFKVGINGQSLLTCIFYLKNGRLDALKCDCNLSRYECVRKIVFLPKKRERSRAPSFCLFRLLSLYCLVSGAWVLLKIASTSIESKL